MSVYANTSIPRARLDSALAMSPGHMRPVILAVRDCGVAWVTVPQRAGRFEIPTSKPFVAIIGDDMHVAMGPAGFLARCDDAFMVRAARAATMRALAPLVCPGGEEGER